MPHPDRFGSLFPDPARRVHNQWMSGKAFSVFITCTGLCKQGQQTQVDRGQCDRCQTCPDLGFGSMLMNPSFR